MGENNFRVCEELQHKGVLSLRGGDGGGGAKTKVYDLLGHECIRQCSDDGKAIKYYAQYPRKMQEFMGPARPFRSKHTNENNKTLEFPRIL